MEVDSMEEVILVDHTEDEGDEVQPEVFEIFEPKIGMMFQSSEEIYEYWKGYSKQIGFPVRRRSSKKGEDGTYKYLCFSCAREGKTKSTASNPLKPQASTRTGCKAKLNAHMESDGQWRITKLNLDHNHGLSPSKARLFPCNRSISGPVKRRLSLNDRAGITMNKSFNALAVEAGGYENLQFIQKDCRNWIDKDRKLRLGEGDAEALKNYFYKMGSQCSGFFHYIDTDTDGRLKNVFWADKRSREAYKEFGDVVTFDTTYLTNKYDMPFAPFVGVNHHGQSTLLGCALISSEETSTFVWLFRTWLNCMSGHAPKGIITDQDRAMQNAIEIVFPGSQHRWCLWHIMHKFPEKLSGYNERESIKFDLQSVVYDSQSPEEFEQTWSDIVDKYQLHKSDWLNRLYDERRRWIPCFLKTSFWAGMSTTQRSESMNSFFDTYVHAKTTLKQFVEQYDNALRSKIQKETQADHDCFSKVVPCATIYPLEKQFQMAYTISKFKEFQKELTGKMYCELSSRQEGVTGTEFDILAHVLVGDPGVLKSVSFRVFINIDVSEVICSCHLFEFRGILCRHALYAILLINKNWLLPEKYIIRWWRKDINRCHTRVKVSFNSLMVTPAQKRYDNLLTTFTELADLVAENENKCAEVLKYINDEMRQLSKQIPICGSSRRAQISIPQNNEPSVENEMYENEVQHILLDPVVTKKKGRPRNRRLQKTYPKSTTQDKSMKPDAPSSNNVQDSFPNGPKRRNVSYTNNVKNLDPNEPPKKKRDVASFNNGQDTRSLSQEPQITPTQDNVNLPNLSPTQENMTLGRMNLTQESIYNTSNVSCMDLLCGMTPQSSYTYVGQQILASQTQFSSYQYGSNVESSSRFKGIVDVEAFEHDVVHLSE